jgi:hypothetical protein
MKILNLLALVAFSLISLHVSAQKNNCSKWGVDSVKATQEISLYREFVKQF